MYYVSKSFNYDNKKLDSRKNKDILGIARRTWNYFKENLTIENNYLVPDNYQTNRDVKLDYRTSSTDISYSLTSVICAYELKFITLKDAIAYLKYICKTNNLQI